MVPVQALHHRRPMAWAAGILALACTALPGCGYAPQMMALVRHDTQVREFFTPQAPKLDFRKNHLFMQSPGRPLGPGEDYIEVYLDGDYLGWVYFGIDDPMIWRTGYQKIDGEFVPAPTAKVRLDSLSLDPAASPPAPAIGDEPPALVFDPAPTL